MRKVELVRNGARSGLVGARPDGRLVAAAGLGSAGGVIDGEERIVHPGRSSRALMAQTELRACRTKPGLLTIVDLTSQDRERFQLAFTGEELRFDWIGSFAKVEGNPSAFRTGMSDDAPANRCRIGVGVMSGPALIFLALE